MKKSQVIVATIILSWAGFVAAAPSVYEMVVAGKECKESTTQSISCQYKVGKSLHISIDGIGDPDTGITFMKSDFDGDFFATYGVGHGCIIVKSGFEKQGGRLYPGFAFISPKNGKVYNNWRECKAGY